MCMNHSKEEASGQHGGLLPGGARCESLSVEILPDDHSVGEVKEG